MQRTLDPQSCCFSSFFICIYCAFCRVSCAKKPFRVFCNIQAMKLLRAGVLKKECAETALTGFEVRNQSFAHKFNSPTGETREHFVYVVVSCSKLRLACVSSRAPFQSFLSFLFRRTLARSLFFSSPFFPLLYFTLLSFQLYHHCHN